MAKTHLLLSNGEQSDRKAKVGRNNEHRTILNHNILTTNEGILSSFGDYDESNLNVRIIDTQEVRGRVLKHISFTIQSSFNENIIVSRRYNDFKWLHNTLAIEHLCIFIPPIPAPNNMGNILKKFDKKFVAQRRYDLQRFLNRIFNHKFLSKSQAFLLFITQQSHARFVEQQKGITEALVWRTYQQIEQFIKNKCFSDSDFIDAHEEDEKYEEETVDDADEKDKEEFIRNECFPDSDFIDAHEEDEKYEEETVDDADEKDKEDAKVYLEQIPRIREVYMRCNERFILMNKIAKNVFKTMTQIVLEINTINEELYGLYDIERKEIPDEVKGKWDKKVQINAFMNKWKQCKQHQMYCFYKYFVLNLKYEHMDCLAVLDVFARYDIVYNKYKKLVNERQRNQHKYPRYELDPEQDQMKKIKRIRSLLNVVCAIILKEQIPKLWETKVDHFNAQIQQFQARISEYTLND
eukprot:1149579_1